jgi:hypothetical protein
MVLVRPLIWFQSGYIFITGVWPLIDIKSFMEVTGYKTDIWLVKTVGALLLPVAFSLASHLFSRSDYKPALVLGSLTAVAFICIDFYYASVDVISDIYIADGMLELIFLIGWVIVFFRLKKTSAENTSVSG